MAKIKRLKDERDAHTFRQRLFGTVTMLEKLADQLADPKVEFTSDALMYLQFEKDAQILERVINDPKKAAAFRRLDPSHSHLIEAASDALESLRRLHSVRNSVLRPHLRPDGKDVVRERKLTADVKDRAALNGVTTAQQELLESQVDTKGHLRLSAAERQTLRNAILAELDVD